MTTLIWAIVVLGALAIIFGLILAVAAKVFEVEVDPRLPEIQACLAGANCGGCGYPGCGGCAEAILAGKAPVTACAPAGPENAAKIAAIMGLEAPSGDKMVAHVMCNGGCNAKENFEYRGVKDCLDARELIKLKVLENSMYNAREASVKLAEATGADCVQVIGSKFVLYLQKKKDSAYADLLK